MILLVSITYSTHKPEHEGEKEKEKEPKELGDVKSKPLADVNETKIKNEFDSVMYPNKEYTTIKFTHYRIDKGGAYIYLNIDGRPAKLIMSETYFNQITK